MLVICQATIGFGKSASREKNNNSLTLILMKAVLVYMSIYRRI